MCSAVALGSTEYVDSNPVAIPAWAMWVYPIMRNIEQFLVQLLTILLLL